jgi:hypothetical protein
VLKRLTEVLSSGICLKEMAEAPMADDPDDPEAAADRLEAALERIARLTAAPPPGHNSAPPETDLSASDIAERLDQLIGRLRAALGLATNETLPEDTQPKGAQDGGGGDKTE